MTRFTWSLATLALFPVASLFLAPASFGADEKGGITVDKEKKTITIDAKVAPRKLEDEKFKGQVYPIEVMACWPYPKGQKAHETVVSFDIKPSEVHKALESLGLKPGTPAVGDTTEPPVGPEVKIFVEFTDASGAMKKVAIQDVLVGPNPQFKLPKFQWRFVGSVMSQPDPEKPEKVYGADLTGTLISVFPVTNQTVFQTQMTMKEEKFLKLEVKKDYLPKPGTPVKLILEVP